MYYHETLFEKKKNACILQNMPGEIRLLGSWNESLMPETRPWSQTGMGSEVAGRSGDSGINRVFIFYPIELYFFLTLPVLLISFCMSSRVSLPYHTHQILIHKGHNPKVLLSDQNCHHHPEE